ncbi:MAG: N-acetylmuramoyl-L-alanine amidase [Phycisphaerae bacterium]|nr:N-acetylmuramoyl-L-alanine amidase [Phycisphaerae bacterium]
MSFKYKNLFIPVIILSSGVLFTGCGESQRSPRPISGQTRPSYTVSIEELASKLGLSVRNSGNSYFELGDAKNTVRLFTDDGGRAYVNGTSIGSVGTVKKVSSKTYVSELLVPQIRGHLISQPVQLPNLGPYEVPRVYGSGTVVIDPGHGGNDPGAQSVLGYWEKDVNLKIAYKLVSYLREAGVDVVMTRESDVYPTLEARAALANRENADLFVSIHCDSNGDRMHRGFTVYRARSASSDSKKAGRLIEKYLSNAGIPSKGLRSADYKVLVQTKGPAVLVECGFMSNYDEAALLMDPWYQNKIARAIADGILEYL